LVKLTNSPVDAHIRKDRHAGDWIGIIKAIETE
jgi:hypothetical protein